ncbi:integrase [Sphingomonas insulae]|uniref:Tyr recombinase domain-containing protein n=1 Tax=Sphingomonas insulae TaxID=424800 RepID=A0ABN1HX89_9SPHN|nr:site-specific integrase [Sphingomonas insulae]NIJ29891.1 integrase [Sphingomonas insulae]
MVQMATPWKHPSGIYYLRRQIPERLRPEMGGSPVFKESLGTRDPAEAARLFVAANARLQVMMDEAEKRILAARSLDEISAERAGDIVSRYLATYRPDNLFHPFYSLARTFYAEETCVRLHGFVAERSTPMPMEDTDNLSFKRGRLLVGDQWLDFVRDRPRSVWIKACDEILVPLFRFATPPVKRIPENEFALMDAWNVRVEEDSRRFHDAVNNPPRARSRSRLDSGLRFGELLDRWAEARTPRPQTIHDTKVAIADLVAFYGDIAVSSFTKDMLLDYRDAARGLPLGMPRADRELPFPARVEKYAGTKLNRVGATTVKKRIGAVQALLGFASQEGWLEHNVGRGVTVEGAGRPKIRRRSFRSEELTTLFGSELFLHPTRLLDRRTKVSDLTLYWLFLFGVTSGARIEEIGQAHLADVVRRDGVLHIDIDDYVTDTEDGAGELEKSVKNDGSRRVVPIHDRLLDIGFERYVDALRRADQRQLFPDLTSNMFSKLTQEASRRAGRYIDRVVADDPRLVFHSFRHTFKDQGREAEIQERILDQLCGHAPTSVGGKYGSGVGLPSLKRNLDRIVFAAIDWDAITAAAANVKWVDLVQKLVARAKITSPSD